jgi:hypothetical protein
MTTAGATLTTLTTRTAWATSPSDPSFIDACTKDCAQYSGGGGGGLFLVFLIVVVLLIIGDMSSGK